MLGHPRRETKKVVGAGGGTCPEISGAGQGRLLSLSFERTVVGDDAWSKRQQKKIKSINQFD